MISSPARSGVACGSCGSDGPLTGSCNTVARWPSHNCVTSTTWPPGNSSARVVMGGLAGLDLAEAGDLAADLARRQERQQRLALGVPLEGEFRAGQQTHRHAGLVGRGKSARKRVAE